MIIKKFPVDFLRNKKPILNYLLAFIALLLLLKLFRFVMISSIGIVSLALIFYGISAVFVSIGHNRRGFLFLGSNIFFIGGILFIVENFQFISPVNLFFPSLFFILGGSLLILFFDTAANKFYFYAAIIFIMSGLLFTFYFGNLGANSFLNGLIEVVISYWVVFLIVLTAIVIFWGKE